MCEAEAKAAAGGPSARAPLSALKRLDYAATSQMLRERSTIFSSRSSSRTSSAGRRRRRRDVGAFESTDDAFVAGRTTIRAWTEGVSDDVGDSVGFMNCDDA